MVTCYFEKVRVDGEFKRERVFETIRELLPPLVMCQVTTVIGFATLAANGLGAVRVYGTYAALGVLCALATTLLLIPAFILLTGARTLREFRESAERLFLLRKLEENEWNVTRTAEAVETPRSNLYKKMEQYGIKREARGRAG